MGNCFSMIGYIKMLASEFNAWNEQATTKANNKNIVCNPYTFSTPDADSNYVWGRVEHDFINGDIKTKEEALALGMVEPQEDS